MKGLDQRLVDIRNFRDYYEINLRDYFNEIHVKRLRLQRKMK